MFGFSKAERAKRDNRVEEIIRSYGVELKASEGNEDKLKGLCPFHNDKTPSLSVTPSKGLWNCFAGCGGGSVIDWIAKIENIGNREAIDFLLARKGAGDRVQGAGKAEKQKEAASDQGAGDKGRKNKQTPGKAESCTLHPDNCTHLKEVSQIYQNTFKTHRKAQEYLKSRGITNPKLWEHYRIGYCDAKTLKKIIPQTGDIFDRLKELGILNNKGNESYYTCLTFPITDDNGQIVGVYGRSIKDKRHQYLKGDHRGVWNHPVVKNHDKLYLTESIIDALSLVQLGIPNAVPLYGTNGLTPDHIRLLTENRIKEITLVLDNDEPGKKGLEKITELLKPLRVQVNSVILPETIKDVNDFLTTGGTGEQFKTLPLSTPANCQLPTANSSINCQLPTADSSTNCQLPTANSSAPDGLIGHTEEEAHLMYNNLMYNIRGIKMKTSDSLRIVITVDSGEGRHTDRLDLYAAKSRRAFANSVAGKLNCQAAKVEDDLLEIISELEGIQQEEQQREEQEVKPYQMTAEEKSEALTLLKDKNLLTRIVTDLDACGYVGEETTKKICYLSATSRIIKNPLSVIIRSSSAAGKSDLMEKVADLMPPEQVRFFSRITPQALYYMPKDHLKHKLLIIDERAGSEDADYSLRNLQSRAKLTLAVVIKDPSSGKSRTVTLELAGPSSVWESTTDSTINPENASRCFELWLDESPEQTSRIHEAQREQFTVSGWKLSNHKERIIRTHRNAQRLIKNIPVEIPYQNKLSFPRSWMRTRRDHKRFLSLVSMISLLHQHQREIHRTPDGQQYIKATINDYDQTYNLVKGILTSTLSPLDKEGQDMHEALNSMVADQAKKAEVQEHQYSFTRKDIREWTKWSESKVRRGLRELNAMEYICPTTGRQGSRYMYRLIVKPRTETGIQGLTTPEELRKQHEK